MQALWQDLRYGARMLVKQPGFTLIAVITLALGIGANTAIFTVLNAVVLRPLAYEHPEQLWMCWESNPQMNLPRFPVSAPNFTDWRARQTVFAQLAAFRDRTFTLTGAGQPEGVTALAASAELFPLLRVKPALGRVFSADEEKDRARVVVLSHQLWQRRFAGDAAIVGRGIRLNGKDYAVIGVMPASFKFLTPEYEAYVPLAFDPQALTQRGRKSYLVLGRLKDGVTPAQAQTELSAIAQSINKNDPEETGFGVLLQSLHELYSEDTTTEMGLLLAAVAFVLLIGCANLSNLLLARAAGRQRELAIRLAVGASRWRIVRQLLTESLLLAVLGGLGGLLLAAWGKDLIVAMSPNDLYRVKELGIDANVFAFTSLLALATGLVFGLAPAWQASRPNLNETLKDAGHSGAGGGRARLRGLLVVSEVALALVLLVGAGLMFRSLRATRAVNPGFEPRNLLTLSLTLPAERYADAPQQADFFQRLLPQLAALPGVQSVGLTNHLPINEDDSQTDFEIEGRPKKSAGAFDLASRRAVNADYFQAMGMRVLRGRAFGERDNDARASRVVILNETMARRYWPNEDPVGKRLVFENVGDKKQPPRWCEIIGVVNDVKYEGLNKPASAEMYYPYAQRPEDTVALALRTTVAPASLLPAVRRQVAALDAELALTQALTMEERMSEFMALDGLIMWLLGTFAALALLLAALGIYGVLAYAVAQRTREIGIRLALGATPGAVVRLVLRQGLTTVLLGIGVGLAAALGLTQWLKTLLFGVRPTDPLTYAATALLLAGVALLACWLPARRATKVDPLIALRCE